MGARAARPSETASRRGAGGGQLGIVGSVVSLGRGLLGLLGLRADADRMMQVVKQRFVSNRALPTLQNPLVTVGIVELEVALVDLTSAAFFPLRLRLRV